MHLSSMAWIHKLSELCLKSKSPYSSDDIQILKCIFINLMESDCWDSINSWFTLQGSRLSLECLWQLQTHSVIQFTSYIYFNENFIPQLSEDFEALMWCQEDAIREQCSECVAELLSVLINLGAQTPRGIYKPGQELLTLVMKKFVTRLLQEPLEVEEPVAFLSYLTHSPVVVSSKLQTFCLSLLRMMVQTSIGDVSMLDAVQHQSERYTSAKSPTVVSQIYREILSKVQAEDIIKELTYCVTSLQGQLNWCWLLTAVSVFVESSSQGIESLRGVIEGWVTQACAGKNESLLLSALLFARQCCVESPQKFCSYSAWFGGLQIRPASAFTFLFMFLSQLVPYEPALYLKIHINKVPSTPSNCHSVVADYKALAKTRLSDLHQTINYVGLFGEYTTTEQEGCKSDVSKVVAHYKQTKEVMKIILEASVFRRQFYEEVFLVELLKDGNTEHVELIEKLYSLGKVPHGLYSRWRKEHF